MSVPAIRRLSAGRVVVRMMCVIGVLRLGHRRRAPSHCLAMHASGRSHALPWQRECDQQDEQNADATHGKILAEQHLGALRCVKFRRDEAVISFFAKMALAKGFCRVST